MKHKVKGVGKAAALKGEEQYRLVLENTSDLVAILDTKGDHVYVSPSYRLLGYEPGELIGTSGLELIHPDDKKRLLPLMLEYARTKVKKLFRMKMQRVTEHITFRIPDKAGKWHHFECTANLIDNPLGKGYGFLLISHDVTDRKHMEDALKASEEQYRDLVEKAGNAIAINDLAGNFKYFNEKFPELFGYTRKEMAGKSLTSLIHPDDAERVLRYHKERLTGAIIPLNYEFKGIKKDGSDIHLEVNVTALKDGEAIVGTRAYLWDITDRKKTEEELRAMSMIDQLTGLYNSRGFSALAHQQIGLANRTSRSFHIIYMDIDNMKWINDNLGHHEGDTALKAVAQVCMMSFRKSDIIGRLGGDEFAVCAIGSMRNSEEIMVDRLQKNLADYNRKVQKGYQLSLSIGFVYYEPQNPSTLDDLLKQADDLMYEQKKQKQKRGTAYCQPVNT
jgi:diguanylate cyclase (GGDEF)-like protein/PAS domain S-box-containing protein